MKTKFLFPLMVLFLLIGCLPSDPYTLRAAADSLIAGTQQAATQTAEAVVRENQAAVLQQMQTQAAIDNAAAATNAVLYSNATATALEHDSRATQAAATATQESALVYATATQAAAFDRATQQAVALAQLQAGATATQQAQINQLEAERAQLDREKVITVAGWVGVFIGLALFFVLAVRVIEMWRETARRQRSWVPGAESFAWESQTGLSVIQPRKMTYPALQVDHKTGAASMPALVPLEAQLYTTLAALAVEMQREISKRTQWMTQAAQAHGLEETPQLSAPSQIPELSPLPMLEGYHVLIAGATGSGKSHTARYLLQARPNVLVLDPHYQPGEWPDHYQVLGGGRDFETIARTIGQFVNLMNDRYQQRNGGQASFAPVHLCVDEIPALVAHEPGAAKMLMQLGMEGRKAGIYLILLSQSVLVRSLHIEGQGDLRENFATVKLAPLSPGTAQNTPRTATVLIGNLNKPEVEEQFMIPALSGAPAPVGTSHVPHFDLAALPEPAPEHDPEQDKKIIQLYAEGHSLNEIQRRVFGYSGGQAYETVKAILQINTSSTG